MEDTSQQSKLLIPGAIVLAGVLIAGAVYFGQAGAAPGGVAQNGAAAPAAPQPTGDVDAVRPIDESDHYFGNPDAELVLIEYSDLECPFCARFHPTAEQLVEEYDGRVAWVYRHFPLNSIHANAAPAAVASECVAELGGNDAFWSFIDSIFKGSRRLGSDLYEELAGELGVDSGALNKCIESGRHEQKVEDDTQNAIEVGGRGTPFTVLLNEDGDATSFSGALPIERIRPLIDEALGDA